MELPQGPLPLVTVGSGRPNAWEAEAALGGAKLFLIGSPYASDFCFSDIVGGPLQVGNSFLRHISILLESSLTVLRHICTLEPAHMAVVL